MRFRIISKFIIMLRLTFTCARGQSGYNAITVGTHLLYIYIYNCLRWLRQQTHR